MASGNSETNMIQDNLQEFVSLFSKTILDGDEVHPRGQMIREVRDAQIVLHPSYPFQTFENRKYDVEYFKKEMRWKLGASKMDDSIKSAAKMWESVQNPDGSFNSNYGQYWFGQQMGLMKAVFELIRDKDSRRACIPMLRDDHLSPETKDTVCTECVTFHIRHNVLHMSVHMRSSDQIFGLGTDVPTFSVLLYLALGMLRDSYPGLKAGRITLTAASSHIYQRHFEVVRKILGEYFNPETAVQLPEPYSVAECLAIIGDRGVIGRHDTNWKLYEFIYG
jgi:Thymidylate synthase